MNLHLSIAPSAMLCPFVSTLWYCASAARAAGTREHVLPTGQMHLVFRLDGPPLRLFGDGADVAGRVVRGPVIGGPRQAFYVKEAHAPVVSVGAQLRPGAARALFGVIASDLAGGHSLLADAWGGHADCALNRIAGAGAPLRQLATFDAVLCERLRPACVLHPQVARALDHMRQALRIDDVVALSGYSHRALNVLFREATGFSPKRYARLQRFQTLLGMLTAAPVRPLGELAYAAGYSDQAHMTREFREFAGLTPLGYRMLAPEAANHVPLAK